MAIPWQTFEETGDPIVDDPGFLARADRCYSYLDWFKNNPHTLRHTAETIIRDAEPYKIGNGGNGFGIYVLVNGDEIAYVGRARAIWNRLRSHRRDGKEFDRYWCFGGMPYDYLDYVETHYIRRLKPYLNKIYVSGTTMMLPLDRIAKASEPKAA